MDFGKVSSAELKIIDLNLPDDLKKNGNILNGKKVNSPKIYLDVQNGAVQNGLVKFIPKELKELNFLNTM
ncbi:MAG TPA: hypothetical protein VF540_01810 [Segetibacter sp.]